MKNKLLLLTPIVGALMFSGCATVLGGGGKQKITINSSKPMNVSLGHASDDNQTVIEPQKIVTPSTITVLRENKNLLLTSDNNEFEPMVIEKELNPWFWGDVIMTSLVSTTTDAVTGAMWKYDDNITIPE
jgi:hypothetical protein